MAETFIGPRPPAGVVRHLDGDPQNDDPGNLRWGTTRENCEDTVRHGRSTRGAKNKQVRLTNEQVRDIRRRRANGERGKELASEYGVTEATICDIHKRRTWEWLE